MDYLIGKISFGEDGTENYLVFQQMHTLLMLVMVVTFIAGNLIDCLIVWLMKELILLKRVIIVSYSKLELLLYPNKSRI